MATKKKTAQVKPWPMEKRLDGGNSPIWKVTPSDSFHAVYIHDEERAIQVSRAPLTPAMISALKTVSFYARINHGDKSQDYGEIVDPVLKALGLQTGEL